MPSHDTQTENSDLIDALNIELQKIEDQITSLNSELEIVIGELERIQQRLFDREERKRKVLSLLHEDSEIPIFENGRVSNHSIDSVTAVPSIGTASRLVSSAQIRRRRPVRQDGSAPKTKRDTIREAVFSVLKDREHFELENRAMHYTELAIEVNSKVTVGGQDPGLNLIAHIHQDERFKNGRRDKKGNPHPYLKRGQYGLSEWYTKLPRSKSSNRK